MMWGALVGALSDHRADVRCPGWAPPLPSGGGVDQTCVWHATARMRAQRRALTLVSAVHVSAAARTLADATSAPRTPMLWAKALGLFPRASSKTEMSASVSADL